MLRDPNSNLGALFEELSNDLAEIQNSHADPHLNTPIGIGTEKVKGMVGKLQQIEDEVRHIVQFAFKDKTVQAVEEASTEMGNEIVRRL